MVVLSDDMPHLESASLGVWVPGLERDEAARLFARPLLTGLFSK